MATFRVGQRVRVVQSHEREPVPHHVGRTGVIISANSLGEYDWFVKFDPPSAWPYEQLFYSDELAPLTDGERDESAERFIEKLKKLSREPMPLEKERA